MRAASRVNRPEAGAYKEEPVPHDDGWRGNRSGGFGRSHAAAHAVKSDARIRRQAESGIASCFCERSRASGTSPGPQRRKRDGGWKSQRDECRRRGNEVPARVHRKAVCSRPPSAARKADGSNSGTAGLSQAAKQAVKLELSGSVSLLERFEKLAAEDFAENPYR